MYYDRALETASREVTRAHQGRRLTALLAELAASNPFYGAQWRRAGVDPRAVRSVEDLPTLPVTTKAEVGADQEAHPPFGTNLTYPLDRYVRIHQTSGTTAEPIRWLDTRESWAWWARCWGFVYAAAGVGPGDRVYLAFSFGPFIGFWSAFAGAEALGAMTISGGGQTSTQRLQAIMDTGATVLVCTPTYALRLREVAAEEGIAIRSSAIRALIHAGEPGASIPTTKRLIEEGWGAKCYDHAGMTEAGAFGYECEPQPGRVHLNEAEFICEVVDPATLRPVGAGERGELIVTNLGRSGMPVVRYRTGDLVERVDDRCACGRTFAAMRGGILGRADDMLTVRGVNVFPSAIENVIRRFPEVAEFQIEVETAREMEELVIRLDAMVGKAEAWQLVEAVTKELRSRLSLRAQVTIVDPGTLPRYELKAKRLVRRARVEQTA